MKRLTQEQAKQKTLNMGCKLIGKYVNNKTKTQFECPKCNKIFEKFPTNVWRGSILCWDCGCCKQSQTQYTAYYDNSLGYLYPDIVKLWSDKNEKSIYEVYPHSHYEFWFKCDNGLNHEYQMSPHDKFSINLGCPYCSGHRVLVGFNDLKSQNPELAQEWDYDENNGKTPEEFTCNSNYKARWVCKRCNYKWKNSISNRNKGNCCPQCNKSKLEKKTAQILNSYNIIYKKEKRFQTCKNQKMLSFDFYLPNHNILIECQGEQHYYPINHFGGQEQFKKQQKRDAIKRKWADKNNYDLLIIPYTEYNNIATILEQKLLK